MNEKVPEINSPSAGDNSTTFPSASEQTEFVSFHIFLPIDTFQVQHCTELYTQRHMWPRITAVALGTSSIGSSFFEISINSHFMPRSVNFGIYWLIIS